MLKFMEIGYVLITLLKVDMVNLGELVATGNNVALKIF